MSSEAPIPILSMNERRLLGVMVEKAKTTPDVYPMSINSLVTGANQKQSRPDREPQRRDIENTLAVLQPKATLRAFRAAASSVGVTTFTTSGASTRSNSRSWPSFVAAARKPRANSGNASRMEPIDDLDALRAAPRRWSNASSCAVSRPRGTTRHDDHARISFAEGSRDSAVAGAARGNDVSGGALFVVRKYRAIRADDD